MTMVVVIRDGRLTSDRNDGVGVWHSRDHFCPPVTVDLRIDLVGSGWTVRQCSNYVYNIYCYFILFNGGFLKDKHTTILFEISVQKFHVEH